MDKGPMEPEPTFAWKPIFDAAWDVARRKLRLVSPEAQITEDDKKLAIRKGLGEARRRIGTISNWIGIVQAARGIAGGSAAANSTRDAQNSFARVRDALQDEVEAFAVGHNSRVGGKNGPTIQGYRSADWLWHEHGMRRERLSEAAGDGNVKTIPAPKGMIDSQGKAVRVLYCEADARQHCMPKRVTRKTLDKLNLGNS